MKKFMCTASIFVLLVALMGSLAIPMPHHIWWDKDFDGFTELSPDTFPLALWLLGNVLGPAMLVGWACFMLYLTWHGAEKICSWLRRKV